MNESQFPGNKDNDSTDFYIFRTASNPENFISANSFNSIVT